MPISKKDRRAREQRAADAAGTRVALTASKVPVKAAKEKIQCKICKVEIEKEKTVRSSEFVCLACDLPPDQFIYSQVFLKQHAEAKHPKQSYAECFDA